MLVLALLAIVVPIGTASFRTSLVEARSAAAMRHLGTLLSFARHHALTSQSVVTLCALDAEGRCHRDWQSAARIVVFVDSNRNRRFDGGERRLREIRWPLRQGELSWRASLARPYIEFQANGGTWQNGTLYYCPQSRDARQARALVLSHSGRHYQPGDSNGDGIREDRSGRNIRCG